MCTYLTGPFLKLLSIFLEMPSDALGILLANTALLLPPWLFCCKRPLGVWLVGLLMGFVEVGC
jgi:hypothetical protein